MSEPTKTKIAAWRVERERLLNESRAAGQSLNRWQSAARMQETVALTEQLERLVAELDDLLAKHGGSNA